MQVLAVIQNYENLSSEVSAGRAVESEVPAARAAKVPARDSAADGTSPASLHRNSKRKSMREVHLPPVAAQLAVFHQAAVPAAADDDDEGIRYVDKLQVRFPGRAAWGA